MEIEIVFNPGSLSLACAAECPTEHLRENT